MVYSKIELVQLSVKIRLILKIVNLLNEFKFDLVVYMKRFKVLTDLQFKIVVCFLDLLNIHLLQLYTNL